MTSERLLWGDFHTHLEDLDRGDEILKAARDNIDFYAVLCYPFIWYRQNGMRIESVKQRPEFLEWWNEHTRLAANHYEPGRFTTFLGYEWHGNRTHWGDHNVIYRDGVGELLDTWDLAELYAQLRGKPAFAIPHHTAYHVGRRGKDWDVYDPALSPVMEICSIHGSSEGPDTPRRMIENVSMGPRAGGNSFQDALARGIRIGVIGSNDGTTLPGRWNQGRAAVWAADCTREAIFEAIARRRTYAVTGDRIALDMNVAGIPMGGEGSATGAADVNVSVVGSHAIDRIELLHDNVVAETYCHSGRWERSTGPGRRKFRFVAGWGPSTKYGFKVPERWSWNCSMRIDDGTLVGVERCIDLLRQTVSVVEPRRCAWRFETAPRDPECSWGNTQGLVFEIDGSEDTTLHFEVDGKKFKLRLGELARNPRVVPLIEENAARVREHFGLDPDALANPDVLYANARKIKLHGAVPEAAYRIEHTFGDVRLHKGTNVFYVRVTQINGQIAWSSPVWIEA